MESDEVTLDLIWLDGAFAKSYVDEFEAACCLAGYNKNNVRIDKSFRYYKKPSQILNSRVSKIYEIIQTWMTVLTRESPLLWFVEQAIINEIPYVNYDLILSECSKTESRKNIIEKEYPDLAFKLGLPKGSDRPNNNEKNSVEDVTGLVEPVIEQVETIEERNTRLLARGIELGLKQYEEKKSLKKINLTKIHRAIEEEEEKKSKIKEPVLKYVVQLKKIKEEIVKLVKSRSD